MDKQKPATIDWAEIQKNIMDALTPYAASHAEGIQIEDAGADEGVRVVVTGLRYPDGVGRGKIVARAFKALGELRLMFEVEHNRYFRGQENSEQGKLFLNDYLFCRSYPVGTQPPLGAYRAAIKGIEKSRMWLVERKERMKATGTEPLFLRVEAATRPQGGDIFMESEEPAEASV